MAAADMQFGLFKETNLIDNANHTCWCIAVTLVTPEGFDFFDGDID